jgi:hypothetical protein
LTSTNANCSTNLGNARQLNNIYAYNVTQLAISSAYWHGLYDTVNTENNVCGQLLDNCTTLNSDCQNALFLVEGDLVICNDNYTIAEYNYTVCEGQVIAANASINSLDSQLNSCDLLVNSLRTQVNTTNESLVTVGNLLGVCRVAYNASNLDDIQVHALLSQAIVNITNAWDAIALCNNNLNYTTNSTAYAYQLLQTCSQELNGTSRLLNQCNAQVNLDAIGIRNISDAFVAVANSLRQCRTLLNDSEYTASTCAAEFGVLNVTASNCAENLAFYEPGYIACTADYANVSALYTACDDVLPGVQTAFRSCNSTLFTTNSSLYSCSQTVIGDNAVILGLQTQNLLLETLIGEFNLTDRSCESTLLTITTNFSTTLTYANNCTTYLSDARLNLQILQNQSDVFYNLAADRLLVIEDLNTQIATCNTNYSIVSSNQTDCLAALSSTTLQLQQAQSNATDTTIQLTYAQANAANCTQVLNTTQIRLTDCGTHYTGILDALDVCNSTLINITAQYTQTSQALYDLEQLYNITQANCTALSLNFVDVTNKLGRDDVNLTETLGDLGDCQNQVVILTGQLGTCNSNLNTTLQTLNSTQYDLGSCVIQNNTWYSNYASELSSFNALQTRYNDLSSNFTLLNNTYIPIAANDSALIPIYNACVQQVQLLISNYTSLNYTYIPIAANDSALIVAYNLLVSSYASCVSQNGSWYTNYQDEVAAFNGCVTQNGTWFTNYQNEVAAFNGCVAQNGTWYTNYQNEVAAFNSLNATCVPIINNDTALIPIYNACVTQVQILVSNYTSLNNTYWPIAGNDSAVIVAYNLLVSSYASCVTQNTTWYTNYQNEVAAFNGCVTQNGTWYTNYQNEVTAFNGCVTQNNTWYSNYQNEVALYNGCVTQNGTWYTNYQNEVTAFNSLNATCVPIINNDTALIPIYNQCVTQVQILVSNYTALNSTYWSIAGNDSAVIVAYNLLVISYASCVTQNTTWYTSYQNEVAAFNGCVTQNGTWYTNYQNEVALYNGCVTQNGTWYTNYQNEVSLYNGCVTQNNTWYTNYQTELALYNQASPTVPNHLYDTVGAAAVANTALVGINTYDFIQYIATGTVNSSFVYYTNNFDGTFTQSTVTGQVGIVGETWVSVIALTGNVIAVLTTVANIRFFVVTSTLIVQTYPTYPLGTTCALGTCIIRQADYDNNGLNDLFISKTSGPTKNVWVLHQNTAGVFTLGTSVGIATGNTAFAIAPVAGIAQMQFVNINAATLEVYNIPTVSPYIITLATTLTQAVTACATYSFVDCVDFDNNGQTDCVMVCTATSMPVFFMAPNSTTSISQASFKSNGGYTGTKAFAAAFAMSIGRNGRPGQFVIEDTSSNNWEFVSITSTSVTIASTVGTTYFLDDLSKTYYGISYLWLPSTYSMTTCLARIVKSGATYTVAIRSSV